MSIQERQQPIIEIVDLVTAYGQRRILDGINLQILPGETMTILGRSGCGKSTLLRHLIGLSKPSQGHIFIKGQDITSLSEEEMLPIRRKIGMLFQGAALFNSMTVGDNVALPLREHTALEEPTIKIMTRMKLDQVGLAGFDDFMPAQLSGGMKKRAALARAIAMDPDILFCDEPSAGLDPIVAVGIDHLILKLKKAFHMTIVVVTHELASVSLIADRVALLDSGRIIALGTVEQLKQSADDKVQQFFNRIPDPESIDRESYLNSLIE
ncbi:MAG: ABC transporter ATP-binding protein [candidate division KSB1 bacterium]|nr:ABC transporter ATP-binding protein [candidate division KSB1 bacterium]MDZ7317971.1 ABC transporter ATP-binding protein [candidate division KSB1 bacterium]MDZ7341064.1 ABC transporter ATP-binding protein [candidate division KSB1 bacterium]